MDVMDLRRGLLMLMANQVQNLDNLFSGVQCYHGYFNGSGAITGQWTADTGNREIYTDYIDADKWSAGDVIFFLSKHTESGVPWFAIAAYDANGDFLSRPAYSGTSSIPTDDGYISAGSIQIPSNAKKIKLTARTYGGELFACKSQDFSDAVPFAEVV